MLPGVFGHDDADLIAFLRDVHGFVVDLDRPDFLLEVRGLTDDVYPVAFVQSAVGNRHARYVQIAIIVCHGADFLFGHVALRGERSRLA